MTEIYKILAQTAWNEAQKEGVFQGSADDIRDGFIHFSTKEQLQGTLEKHYKGQKDLILLAIIESDLGENLKWEPSRGGALFPHLYAPLPTSHVLWEKPLELTNDGSHIIPKL